MKEQISQEELNERVAILRRFRSLLEEQRAKFQEYLNVLEAQERKIHIEDADAIIAHSELETQIVGSIQALQKVITPMQKLYESSHASTYNPHEAVPIMNIQDELSALQVRVLEQNEKNRNLLKSHITEVRAQIAGFRNPYRNAHSVYADRAESGMLFSQEA